MKRLAVDEGRPPERSPPAPAAVPAPDAEPSVYEIRYEFLLRDGSQRTFVVRLDAETLADITPIDPASVPRWAMLESSQCDVCPLRAETSPHCPAAARLTPLVRSFSQVLSHERARVRVRFPEREVVKETAVKEGVGSLLGLYMATSGCPVMAALRPMVRFHLPFATRLETIFRAASSYLVGQFLARKDGRAPDWELRGLSETYALISRVNRAFALRLRSAVELDANLNALVQLDVLAKALPESIEEDLSELRFLFNAARPVDPAPGGP